MENFSVKTYSAEETERAGADIVKRLLSEKREGASYLFIMLRGDLGAGKTAFCRGAASLLSPGSRVKSPSYTIVNEYRRGDVPLFHFDLYRLGEGADLSDIGFFEYVSSGHCIIEWSEYLRDEYIPDGAFAVHISKNSENERTISVRRAGTEDLIKN